MKPVAGRWLPAGMLTAGLIVGSVLGSQQRVPLRAPLDAVVPKEIEGYHGRDVPLAGAERRVAGVTSYLQRVYATPTRNPLEFFTIYIGYYDTQSQGKTIHSPRNCLPGSGWEALTSQSVSIPTAAGRVRVNRYLLQRGAQRALVLYWYQGRGRVEANEYLVKRDLLRDAALKHRTEEALVRVMVPVTGRDDAAFVLAARVASTLVSAAAAALPLSEPALAVSSVAHR